MSILIDGLFAGLVLMILASCGTAPLHPRESTPDVNAMLQRIQAAAARDHSTISIVALHAPGVAALEKAAREDACNERLGMAADKLHQALREEPQSPSLLQAQAELALRRHDWRAAEQQALDSWKHGPRLGALCARNWQTVIEVRRINRDTDAVNTAQHWLARCHVKPVPRY